MYTTSIEAEFQSSAKVLHSAVSKNKTGRTSLGNLDIDDYSETELTRAVLEHAMHGQTTRQIATVNAQFYVLAEKLLSFRTCLNRAEYLCADGMPIVWACKTFGKRAVPRIAGVDLIADLSRAGAKRGMRVFLLGGHPGTAEATADFLRETYPGLKIAGVRCPSQGFEKDPVALSETLEEIKAAKPEVIFVALGAPKQEFFIDQHIRPLKIPIAIGIGGSLEILSGRLRRAPKWMQEKGLEWCYRLLHEPRRLWKRYLIGNVEFIWCVFKWRCRQVRSPSNATA